MKSLFRRIINYYKQVYWESGHWLRLVFSWFVMGAILGGLVFFAYPNLLEKIIGVFDEKFGQNPPLDFNLVIGIFLNNLQASAIALFGGLLIGLGPFIVVVTNGFLLGYLLFAIIMISPSQPLESLTVLAAGILPHGIFEIPAFLLAAGLGLKLGIEWLKKENYGQRLKVLGHNFKYALVVGVPAVTIILFIAALVEVYVTGNLINSIAP
jgi:stage II sporulation protein M